MSQEKPPKVSLIKSAWKNRKLIAEGILNKIQAKQEVVNIASERKLICMKCPMHSTNSKKLLGYETERLDEHCIVCGCNIELKVYSLHSECPDKPPRWEAVVDDELENFNIQQYINSNSDD